MRRIYWVGLPIFLMLSGCKKDSVAMNNAVNSANSVTTSMPSAAEMAQMRDDRARIVAALQKAHGTLPNFIKALQKPKPSQTQFSVKCAVADGGKMRHVWIDNVTYDGKKFHGKLGNRLMNKNAKSGSKVEVAPDGVSDWMYIENRKLVGGYTVRALRDGLSAQDKKKFDKDLPFVVN